MFGKEINDRETLIELIESARYWGSNTSAEIADHLIANGVVIQKQGKMYSLEAVDKFRDELMNKFMKLCNYNDFGELRLEKIADTVNDVYDKCIDDLLQTANQG